MTKLWSKFLMSKPELQEALNELWTQIEAEKHATGELQPTCFFNVYHEEAVENGDCPDLVYTPVIKEDSNKTYQIDGYSLNAERGELHLVISDFHTSNELETIHKSTVDQLFRRAERFFDNARLPEFINRLEETSPAFEAAYPIYMNQSEIKRIRFIIFTNTRFATQSKTVESKNKEKRTYTYNIIDLNRFSEIQSAKVSEESLKIDFIELNSKGLPALAAHNEEGKYESYLVAMPGELLANIYGLYGARLLEQNVRTFLQARTKVNKGIINTLNKAPEMFFAYNNGLTVTASGVEIDKYQNSITVIRSIKNMQIVNGGQTTASILYAKDKSKIDLSKVFVQMKLTVIEPEQVDEVVPKISRYSNTQNKVNEADFFASHQFHVEMEKISRRLTTPIKAGELQRSKWFYERARGQYKDKKAYGTPAQRRKFEAEFPRYQMITKTDLAKYILSFEMEPHIVSRGAQKCFLEFADRIDKQWKNDPDQFNEGWFKHSVAKTILFRTCDKLVGNAEWYKEDRGYKAQIVTYTVAWLLNWARQKRKTIDLDQIWHNQELSSELKEYLPKIASFIAKEIKNAPSSVKNISEYCKQQACWHRISKLDFYIPERLFESFISIDEQNKRQHENKKTQKIDKGIELDRMLLAISGQVEDIIDFARKQDILTPEGSKGLTKVKNHNFKLTQKERRAVSELLKNLDELEYELPQML